MTHRPVPGEPRLGSSDSVTFGPGRHSERQPDGATPGGSRIFGDSDWKLPRRLVSRAGGSVRAAASCARPRQPAGMVCCADARRLILFDVHQDTVPTEGMTISPFEPEITQGRLSGRGACDVKGSMAAMLATFARLVKERPRGSASVLLACTVDEEFTHTGSSRLAETPHGAELAVVAEPTLLDLVHCHKGALRWKIRTNGVACHSSTPHLGVSAIYRMGRVLDMLSKYAGELAASTPDPILGAAHLVGRSNRGGTQRQCRSRLVRDRGRSPVDSW